MEFVWRSAVPCSPLDEVIGSRRERRPVTHAKFLGSFYRSTIYKGRENLSMPFSKIILGVTRSQALKMQNR